MPVSTFQQPSPDAELIRCRWWGRITPVGEAARGTAHITYTGPIPMLDDDPTEPTGLYWQDQHIELEIVQRGIRGIMADFGYFEVWLPATNDPDLLGGGYPYRCQVEISNASIQPKPFTFNVDRSAPSGIVLLNRGEVTTNAMFGGAPVQVVSWADHKALQDSVFAMSQRLDSLVTASGGGTDLPTTAAIQDVVLATLTGNVRTDAMSRKAEVFTNAAEVEAVVKPAVDARVAVNVAQVFTPIEKSIGRDNIEAAAAIHASRHGLGGADQISIHAAQINDGTVGTARLGTGAAGDGSRVLMDNGTWAPIAIAASQITSGTLAAARIAGTATDGYVAKLVGGAPTWAELMPLNPTQAEIDAMPVGSYYATTV